MKDRLMVCTLLIMLSLAEAVNMEAAEQVTGSQTADANDLTLNQVLSEAGAALAAKDPALAKTLYEAARVSDPDNLTTLRSILRCRWLESGLDTTKIEIPRFESPGVERAWTTYLTGLGHSYAMENEEAAETFSQALDVLKVKEWHSEALADMGDVFFFEKDWKQAAKCFEELIDREVHPFDYRCRLAAIYRIQDEENKFLEQLRKAYDDDPADRFWGWQTARLLYAREKWKDVKEIVDAYEHEDRQAKKPFPDDPMEREEIGCDYLRRGMDELAVKALRALGSNGQLSLEGMRCLAMLDAKDGKTAEATNLLKQLRAEDPLDSRNHSLHAWVLLRSGRGADAQAEFERALKWNPADRLAFQGVYILALGEKQAPDMPMLPTVSDSGGAEAEEYL
ncbi:MAG: hypothetical protein KJ563_07550, partial [Candidatus Thermoplasmatota archaeon]|nr:hypothetical protein [Candidatus Thermoplasmatota archaeon]